MSYMIVRFHQDAPREVIDTGLTLAEAQAHCNDPTTKGGEFSEGTAWFDGYEAESDDAEEDDIEVVTTIIIVDEAHGHG